MRKRRGRFTTIDRRKKTNACQLEGVQNKISCDAPNNAVPSEVIEILSENEAPQSQLRCPGYKLNLPDGKSPHTAYPFALHDTHNLPWDYRVKNNKMFLFARSCDGEAPSKDQPCHRCNRLGRNNILSGICERMKHGIREGTTYSHYGIAGLRELLRLQNRQAEHYRLSALNQARKVARKARALADHKRFLTAVASKRVERVDRIIRLGLRHGRGIRSLLDQCVKAAGGLYKPKDYQEEDYMRGLVLWKLGGNRIASFAHRALGLPSITTLKNQVRIPPLVLSPGIPTAKEVSKNVEMSFEGMEDVMKPPPGAQNNHAVLMFDEIATEKRLRWEPKTDMLVGVCREHAQNAPLEFKTHADMEEVFHAIDEDKVHLAGEVSPH